MLHQNDDAMPVEDGVRKALSRFSRFALLNIYAHALRVRSIASARKRATRLRCLEPRPIEALSAESFILIDGLHREPASAVFVGG
ncbi:hypothetical protein [Bradyrhizobium liaoningense]|uniref:hypothetical protein n=1 Tax=Bradyrhizobium liaoningense TaxID=43992 RepID=UPI0012FD9387|nr:hypothetical protein [Bradyrhizobium liaoningense]